jgi:hypothetical protein
MAITQPALARAMARDFARAVPPEAHLSRLWVWSEHGHIDPERDYVELAAFVDPADSSAETQLNEAVDRLNDLYPEVNKMAYLLGPHVPGGRTPEQWVNPKAEEIDLGNLDDE